MKRLFFIILNACITNVDKREIWIKEQGYYKIDLIYEQLLYSSYSYCIKHKKFYYY